MAGPERLTALSTQYTRLTPGPGARIGSLLLTLLGFLFNVLRLHKPHPGKSRPSRYSPVFMWPGFRASAPVPAFLAGRQPRPRPNQPCLATPATWGPGWAWAPSGRSQPHPGLPASSLTPFTDLGLRSGPSGATFQVGLGPRPHPGKRLQP